MSFIDRHIGPNQSEITEMLLALQTLSLDDLTARVVPEQILFRGELGLGQSMSEREVISELKTKFSANEVWRSYIGLGYYGTITPAVIQRNILENPGWYTQYTPYQAEISQGRLEALLNFQTMICDLTAMAVANASMLDEATAAAEAMALAFRSKGSDSKNVFLVADTVFPQTLDVINTRAEPLGIKVQTFNPLDYQVDPNTFAATIFGVLLQYPDLYGEVSDYSALVSKIKGGGSRDDVKDNCVVVVAADLLALTLLKPPGEWGGDIVVGSTQRFGVPFGFGGPHAAYFAVKDEFKRLMPGRLIGVSKDSFGRAALRLSLQTREQHIRREKATSNICTAQVLLAIMASMYAVYHGPKGLKDIATDIHLKATTLKNVLARNGLKILNQTCFDTVSIADGGMRTSILERARLAKINLNENLDDVITVSIDETVSEGDLCAIAKILIGNDVSKDVTAEIKKGGERGSATVGEMFKRESDYLSAPVFNKYHSETEFLRYVTRLQSKDLSLAVSMIPLGSCTMKLNATTEMIPVTWPEVGQIHPFAPLSQVRGYLAMINELEDMLCAITGFTAASLQPNAGSQGEYAGLLAIREYHFSKGDTERNICLIPTSAHGTNPASAAMAGMKVVAVKCDCSGNIDLDDLREKTKQNAQNLAALMVTYPSTHGVFEEGIKEVCSIVHQHGGQVYMDGANLNAQVGLTKPAEIGADVCHINLHKTFCIPHGGGGPGVGPIVVKEHLAEFLPGHRFGSLERSNGVVSAAPWGSASILPISWAYIKLMGAEGLKKATQVAILNANYIAKRLNPHYPVLYTGRGGLVAHECILDLRELKKNSGVEVEDVAKRLMDYGFHAPTVSFPVPGTMMIEPTESESKGEIDRFCDALIAIREEIREIEEGKGDKVNNLLKGAPHTAESCITDEWTRPYSRERAAYPVAELRNYKFWPSVGRVDNVYGDKNLFCTCGDWTEVGGA